MWQRSRSPFVGEQHVEVELLGERPVHAEARRVERDGLGGVVGRANDLRVPPDPAAADVASARRPRPPDPVVLREMERQGQAVHAPAHDRDVVARRELGGRGTGDDGRAPSRASSSAASVADAVLEVRQRACAGTRGNDGGRVSASTSRRRGRPRLDRSAAAGKLQLREPREGIGRHPRPQEERGAIRRRRRGRSRRRSGGHRAVERRPRALAHEQRLARREAERPGDVPGAHEGSSPAADTEHGEDRRWPTAELRHGGSPLGVLERRRTRARGVARPSRRSGKTPSTARIQPRPIAPHERARALAPR